MIKEPSKFVQAFGGKNTPPANPAPENGAGAAEEKGEGEDANKSEEAVGKAAPEPKQPEAEVEKGATVTKEKATEAPGTNASEIDDNKVLEFLNKKNGTNHSSLEDFTKSLNPEPANIETKELDKEVSMFARFKEQHGGTMSDYLALQKDWNEVDDIEVLREKERVEGGIKLNDTDADILIKKRYGLDEDEDLSKLSKADELAIRRDAGKFRKEKLTSQQEVLKSLETTKEESKDKSDGPVGETVKLSNGQVVNKEEFLKMREEYDNARTKAVEGIENFETSFTFKDSDGEHTIDIKLPYEEKDKHSMLSLTEDTGILMQKLNFVDADGNMDHKAFNEGAFWANPKTREPFLKKMFNNVFSQGLETQLKKERNVNFKKTTPAPKGEEVKKNEIDKSRLPNANGLRTPRHSFNR